MHQRFGDNFKHILQGGNASEDNDKVQYDAEYSAAGHLLQNGRENNKQQTGAAGGIHLIGKARGDHHKGGNNRRDGVE